MKFVDEATISVQAGHGGNGSKSFRREKYIPFGGPDGGDGGKGGSVYLKAYPGLNTLVDFRYIREIKAQNGECGHGKQCYGKAGEDKEIHVPAGTVVYDDKTQECLGDIKELGQRLLVAKGGQGGLGNIHFKSSTNRAPQYAMPGKQGEARRLRLELKLLADVGLLGMPNAGKSTFLRSVSKATPKVADYPFTTLTPQLGTVRLSQGQSFVIADIPGIIEGAHEGIGLGLQFLKHISRTKLLLQLVDMAPMIGSPIQTIHSIIHELVQYDSSLANKARWIILNKADCLTSEDAQKVEREVRSTFPDQKVFVISSLAKTGIEPLLYEVWDQLKEESLIS